MEDSIVKALWEARRKEEVEFASHPGAAGKGHSSGMRYLQDRGVISESDCSENNTMSPVFGMIEGKDYVIHSPINYTLSSALDDYCDKDISSLSNAMPSRSFHCREESKTPPSHVELSPTKRLINKSNEKVKHAYDLITKIKTQNGILRSPQLMNFPSPTYRKQRSSNASLESAIMKAQKDIERVRNSLENPNPAKLPTSTAENSQKGKSQLLLAEQDILPSSPERNRLIAELEAAKATAESYRHDLMLAQVETEKAKLAAEKTQLQAVHDALIEQTKKTAFEEIERLKKDVAEAELKALSLVSRLRDEELARLELEREVADKIAKSKENQQAAEEAIKLRAEMEAEAARAQQNAREEISKSKAELEDIKTKAAVEISEIEAKFKSECEMITKNIRNEVESESAMKLSHLQNRLESAEFERKKAEDEVLQLTAELKAREEEIRKRDLEEIAARKRAEDEVRAKSTAAIIITAFMKESAKKVRRANEREAAAKSIMKKFLRGKRSEMIERHDFNDEQKGNGISMAVSKAADNYEEKAAQERMRLERAVVEEATKMMSDQLAVSAKLPECDDASHHQDQVIENTNVSDLNLTLEIEELHSQLLQKCEELSKAKSDLAQVQDDVMQLKRSKQHLIESLRGDAGIKDDTNLTSSRGSFHRSESLGYDFSESDVFDKARRSTVYEDCKQVNVDNIKEKLFRRSSSSDECAPAENVSEQVKRAQILRKAFESAERVRNTKEPLLQKNPPSNNVARLKEEIQALVDEKRSVLDQHNLLVKEVEIRRKEISRAEESLGRQQSQLSTDGMLVRSRSVKSNVTQDDPLSDMSTDNEKDSSLHRTGAQDKFGIKSENKPVASSSGPHSPARDSGKGAAEELTPEKQDEAERRAKTERLKAQAAARRAAKEQKGKPSPDVVVGIKSEDKPVASSSGPHSPARDSGKGAAEELTPEKQDEAERRAKTERLKAQAAARRAAKEQKGKPSPDVVVGIKSEDKPVASSSGPHSPARDSGKGAAEELTPEKQDEAERRAKTERLKAQAAARRAAKEQKGKPSPDVVVGIKSEDKPVASSSGPHSPARDSGKGAAEELTPEKQDEAERRAKTERLKAQAAARRAAKEQKGKPSPQDQGQPVDKNEGKSVANKPSSSSPSVTPQEQEKSLHLNEPTDGVIKGSDPSRECQSYPEALRGSQDTHGHEYDFLKKDYDVPKRMSVNIDCESVSVKKLRSHYDDTYVVSPKASADLHPIEEGKEPTSLRRVLPKKGMRTKEDMDRMLDRSASILQTGSFFNRYELGDVLGSGAFSTVRQALDKQRGEVVAVKCIDHATLTIDDEEQLHQEVAVLRVIDHPHVLKFHGFYKEEGSEKKGTAKLTPETPLSEYKHKKMYYLVTECLSGGELFNRIVHKAYYSEKDARGVIYILLQTIAYLHHHRIVHRDLKPENLLLYADDDTSIKIADFGFAEQTDGFISLKTQCGTPGYVAPEILLGLPYGKAVDMWAIGVIMYVLLGGYPPFSHGDTRSITESDVEFHPEYWDSISQDAKDLIRKLLRKDPLERWSAEEALKHPWMLLDEAEISSNLGTNLETFQKSHRLRKFRGAVKAIIATNRIAKVMGSFTIAKGKLDKEILEESNCESISKNTEGLNKSSSSVSYKNHASASVESKDVERLSSSKRRSGSSESEKMKEKLDTLLDRSASVIENGSFFDLYELGDVLGSGAFSTVRKAKNKNTGEEVAVKCIDYKCLSRNDEEQLHQEVAVLQVIDHPHVLKFHGFYKEEGTGKRGLPLLTPETPLSEYKHKKMYYLVTECLSGGELFNRIVHKEFYSEKDARGVIYILLQTIAYLHHHRIVHRDLKPENLLLYADDDTSIKIADFGFAEQTDGFISLKTQCGTPGYVAPEILLGLPYGKAVDMWAIGVIMYVLLGGYPPFSHEDNQSTIKSDVEFHPEYWDSISQDAKDLIRKLLRKDPLERWSAEEALKHPWMLLDEAEISSNLGTNLEMFQRFHGSRRFKAAVKAVIAANRMRKVLATLGIDKDPIFAKNESGSRHQTIRYKNGAVYKGECVNGLRHGKGTYESDQEETYYCGLWKNDMRNGKGQSISEHISYDGDWVDDQTVGSGTMNYSDGSEYTGDVIQNFVRHGFGRYVGADGNVIEGRWENDDPA